MASVTRFGRLAFYGLVPSLVLPAVLTGAGAVRAMSWPGVGPAAISVFAFVTFGSMTLNTWFLLRHPQSFMERSLPRRLVVTTGLLVGVLVAWSITYAFGASVVSMAGFALAVIVLSILNFVSAANRWWKTMAVPRRTEIDLSTAGRILAGCYLIIGAFVVIATLVGAFFPGTFPWGGLASVWPIVILGAPWSFPLAILGFIASTSPPGEIALTLPALGVIANIVIVALVVWNPRARVRIVNWFFRLRGVSET